MNSAALLSLLFAAAAPAIACAQPAAPSPESPAPAPAPFVAADAKLAVESLAKALEENFVFPEVGHRYAAALRAKLASGAYSNFATAEDFSKAVTADLQAIHKDGHLRLHPPGLERGPQGARRGPPPGSAIEKAGWLADGVAYISFGMFPGNEATMGALRKFLDEHKSAKTLIIDARGHRGGGLAEMDLMFPLFYDKAQPLVQMDTRRAVEERYGSPMPDGPTLQKVAGPDSIVRRTHSVIPAAEETGLRNAKIYLLTSKKTASAAEHLALSLKRTKRATLVGESTAGAGHFGGMVPMGGGYMAFIPVGRTFDPDTNQGWEGTGVKPDVEVPADQALDEALRRAGVAADKVKVLAAVN